MKKTETQTGSKKLAEINDIRQWVIDGKTISWLSPEHCMVLTGYNYEKGVVYAADPLEGSMEYNMERFEYTYKKLLSQAVVIK